MAVLLRVVSPPCAPDTQTPVVASGRRPLADRMRPQQFDEFVGQDHLLAPGTPLRQAMEAGRPHSMVLWGPPGTGKTTLARLMAKYCRAQFFSLSAVLAGVKEVRMAVDKAQRARSEAERETVLFVDEVHRFNKSQQDAFLPYVEDGTFIFVGATTENPSFELNNALLSRTRVYLLKGLRTEDIRIVINHASEVLAGAPWLWRKTYASDWLKRRTVMPAGA